MSVEESRPIDSQLRLRSVPFINVTDSYTGVTGQSFSERGALFERSRAILHKAFLDSGGQSRIVGIGTSAIQPDRRLTASISARITHASRLLPTSQRTHAPAQNVVLPPNLAQQNAGHGTHVASIAAGRRVRAVRGGVAPEALLLIIISSSDELTGYSHAHMAALKFIDKIATELDMPVVANVSQGMNAGAHDGKSLVEIGFDGFSEGGRKAGRVVVKSAGNEGDRQGHARLKPAAGAMKLPWTCEGHVAARSTRAVVELCQPVQVQPDRAVRSDDGLGGSRKSDSERKLRGVPHELRLVRRHVDSGDSRLTLELEAASRSIPAGAWSRRAAR